MCRVRARKFPFGYYRAALPAVLDYHRRFGDYLHSCRADAQSGDVFTVPAARECREKEQAFPLYRPLSGQREQILRPDDRTGVRAFSAYVCGFRNPACRYLGDEPAGSPEFYVPRGSGLLYRGIGAARGRHDRADARGHGPRRALPEEGPRRRVCAQRDGVEPPCGDEPGAQSAHRHPQAVGRARDGGYRRGDAARARRAVALSREQGLPLDAAGDSRTGAVGRFRDGARGARQHDLRRAATGGRYADVLRRADARTDGAVVVDAGRHSAALLRRGPRQGAVAGRLDVGRLLDDEGLHGVDIRQ